MEVLIITGSIVLAVGSLFLLFSGSFGRQKSAEERAEAIETIEELADRGALRATDAELAGDLGDAAIDELIKKGRTRLTKLMQAKEGQAAVDAKLRREQEEEVERRRTMLAPILRKTKEDSRTRPRDEELHADWGHLHTSLAEWDEARDAYERALAFGLSDEKKRAVVHLLYGRILARQDLPMIMHDLTANYYGLKAGRYDVIRDFIPDSRRYESWFSREFRWATIDMDLPRGPDDPDLVKHHLDESIKLFERYLKRDPSDLDSMRIVAGLYECTGRAKAKVRMEVLIKEAEIRRQTGTREPQRYSTNAHQKGVAFEHRCLTLLEAMGYEVIHVGTTGDGGIDIRAKDPTPLKGATIIVQCKDQKQAIGEPRVREFYGLVVSEGVNKGVFMTTADFTAPAQKFANGKRLELIDGSTLVELESQIDSR